MKIGVLSDTHLRADQTLPQALADGLDGVDAILHAGDIVDMAVIFELEQIAPVKAVCGNMDTPEVRRRFPARDIIELDGVRVGLIHGSGPPDSLADRVRSEFDEDIDAIVFGHSHHALCRRFDDTLMFNPGSATDRRFAPYCSFGMMRTENAAIIDAQIVKL